MTVNNYTLASLADETSGIKNRYFPSAASKKADQYLNNYKIFLIPTFVGIATGLISALITTHVHSVYTLIPLGLGVGTFVIGAGGMGRSLYQVHRNLSVKEITDLIGVDGGTAIKDFNRQIDAINEEGFNAELVKQEYQLRIQAIYQKVIKVINITEIY